MLILNGTLRQCLYGIYGHSAQGYHYSPWNLRASFIPRQTGRQTETDPYIRAITNTIIWEAYSIFKYGMNLRLSAMTCCQEASIPAPIFSPTSSPSWYNHKYAWNSLISLQSSMYVFNPPNSGKIVTVTL